MKKIALILVLTTTLLIFIPLTALCGPLEWSRSANAQTASALIMTGSGYFDGILVVPDGTNAITVTFYDSTSGSGTQFISPIVVAGDGGAAFLSPPHPIRIYTGIYITVAGDGAEKYTVLYRTDK